MYKIDGDSSWDLLQDVLGCLVEGDLSSQQVGAIQDLRVAFKMRA
jgi:hypothetical protein